MTSGGYPAVMSTLTLACPAKVNLALSVGSPRPADGYHPIASWMATLDFADAMTLAALDAGPSRFDLHFARDAPKPQAIDWPLEKDLAWRAHRLLEQHVGRPLPVAMTLAKRIPAGAGLAGGSSNAAAMLVGLNRLFELQLPEAALAELATKLGSDIAFLVAALHGRPAAIVTGLGEQVTPIAPRALHLVLAFPRFGCPTGPVYKAFDQSLASASRPPAVERVRELAGATAVASESLFNDLSEPACIVAPELAELREALAARVARPVHVSGSGSTLFFLARDADEAARLAQAVRESPGLPAVATVTQG